MHRVLVEPTAAFDHTADVLIIGAGGCGLCAALAARDGGADALVLERDKLVAGTTAMSTGMIPAAGAPEQAAIGIEDSPALLAADVAAKTKGTADPAMALRLAEESAETIAWLRERHGAPLALVTGFLYPGHSRMRMFGTPNRTGAELIAALTAAAARAGVDVLTEALAKDLIVDGDSAVLGVEIVRPDGRRERIGCRTLVLASSGFAGNPQLLARFAPEILEATFHGHPGNKGAAVEWGEALGAAFADMDSYQGHGGLAHGHGIPILWPVIMQGGFQVNRLGIRFSDETQGYSEQAVKVVAQPGKAAWTIFDQRIHDMMTAFDDFRDAKRAGAIVRGETIADLADRLGLPAAALERTLADARSAAYGYSADPFGRSFDAADLLVPPFYAAKVTGALFHTQGGLVVDADARVLRQDGTPFPNLFAGGGAARGVSGRGASGYLAGNGLWTATTLGKLAGRAAARQIAGART
jgi:fumarate reductase flavoprotein subunit